MGQAAASSFHEMWNIHYTLYTIHYQYDTLYHNQDLDQVVGDVPSKISTGSQNNGNIWYEVAPVVAKYAIAKSKSHNIPLRKKLIYNLPVHYSH